MVTRAQIAPLRLEAGMPIPFGGDRMTTVPAELAAAFEPGDRLIVVQTTGDLLHVPGGAAALVDHAVDRAQRAFTALAAVSEAQVTSFFAEFAAALRDEERFAPIAAANAVDVDDARRRGRSTTRLVLSPAMRASMIAGLEAWRDRDSPRDSLIRVVEHAGWAVEERRAPLGVVGFVFEGRPNVFADATGVLRTGNAVVFRIGSDALTTARAIMEHAVEPARVFAGLPEGVVGLLDSPLRATGWALFADSRLALAVARGSGEAVEQLGSVARQAGVTASLHGTGGAWMLVGETAEAGRLADVVRHSLDRKVCNTLNVCCVVASRAAELLPVIVEAARAAAAAGGSSARVHVVRGSEPWCEAAWFVERVAVERADGSHDEPFADSVAEQDLATEWEWERSPELTVAVVADLDEAARLFNRYSPRFVASLITEEQAEADRLYGLLDAPFLGDGFTRWVDGQYALGVPELGLSNWEGGRLACRGGVLSGDSMHTIRLRVRQPDAGVHR